MAEKRIDCNYCPKHLTDDNPGLQSYSFSELRLHMAALHVDSDSSNEIYECDGSPIRPSECSPNQKFRTIAVNEYVRHMELMHPNQVIPFHLRYKAAMANLMAELNYHSAEAEEDLNQIIDYLMKPSLSPNEGRSGSSGTSSLLTPDSPEKLDGVNPKMGATSDEPACDVTVKRTETIDQQLSIDVNVATSFDPNLENEAESSDSTGTSALSSLSLVSLEVGTNLSIAAPTEAIGSTINDSPVDGSTRSPKKSVTRGMFTSTQFRDAVKKLNDQYAAKAKKDVVLVSCEICCTKIRFDIGSRATLFHSMTHVDHPIFQCSLCNHSCRYYNQWYSHFKCWHPEEKNCVDSGLASLVNFHTDNRKKYESEIVQKLKQCFDC